ncbi:KGGVGR-motif variant AAA ATPase [Aquimarina pacifica]|uniref:KGGVGR-motif variant AAA ATPase n=1 Tax=Aquimarina pacifica TaxID=1296415 RepID=UPI000471EEB7|nr:AAA family ATPase [Aquimarina pacifica]
MKTITFYSYKGGVGRTLALSNIAKRLSEFGKKVCLLDFDLEAPGLHHKFRKNIAQEKINNGIVDYIYEFSQNKTLPSNISDYVTKVSFQSKYLEDIDLIAAGDTNSKEYWRKLSMINWNELFYQENSQGIALFVDLKEKLKKELNPDFLIVDSRTGITDVSGITMSILADEIVLMAARNWENIEGIKQVINTLTIPENSFKEGIPKINFVLSRIPFFSDPKEKYKVQYAKSSIFETINKYLDNNNDNDYQLEKIFLIHSDPELELEEKFKIGYEYDRNNLDDQKPPTSIDYLELFQELTKNELTKNERERFNALRRAKLLIEQAKKSNDKSNKIKLLESALNLNPESNEIYHDLAVLSYEIGDYKNAKKFIELALSINSNSIKSLYIKGLTLSKLNKKNEAEKIYLDILKKNDRFLGAMIGLGHIYNDKGENEKALEYHMRAVEIRPDFEYGYNSVANALRNIGNYEKALDYIYQGLAINPHNIYLTVTLAEVHAHLNNNREFYKNLELAFTFGLDNDLFQEIIIKESIYKPYLQDKKFLDLLDKYNITIDFSLFV